MTLKHLRARIAELGEAPKRSAAEQINAAHLTSSALKGSATSQSKAGGIAPCGKPVDDPSE
jgi:hypothetical protein